MKLSVMDLASLGILACALTLTTVVVKREFFEAPSTSPTKRVPRRGDLHLVGRVLGSNDAKVPVVVFADFQCPYCRRAQPLIQQILTTHQGRVKILFRHLPLESIHPDAWASALAVECAAEQGAFVAYHDLLFAKQDSIGKISWLDFAGRAGVASSSNFQSCFEGERPRNVVERDVLLARQLGIEGTPAFIIGDEMYAGLPTAEWIEKQLAREQGRSNTATKSK